MDSEQKMKKAFESLLGNDFEKAIEWFEKAVAEQPQNAEYHYRLSITYSRSNKLSKALDHAKEACRLHPVNEKYKLHLQHILSLHFMTKAENFIAEKQYGRAIDILNDAIRLDPLALEAYLLLGIAQAELGRINDALEAIDEALRLDPHHEMAQKLHQQYTNERN